MRPAESAAGLRQGLVGGLHLEALQVGQGLVVEEHRLQRRCPSAFSAPSLVAGQRGRILAAGELDVREVVRGHRDRRGSTSGARDRGWRRPRSGRPCGAGRPGGRRGPIVRRRLGGAARARPRPRGSGHPPRTTRSPRTGGCAPSPCASSSRLSWPGPTAKARRQQEERDELLAPRPCRRSSRASHHGKSQPHPWKVATGSSSSSRCRARATLPTPAGCPSASSMSWRRSGPWRSTMAVAKTAAATKRPSRTTGTRRVSPW